MPPPDGGSEAPSEDEGRWGRLERRRGRGRQRRSPIPGVMEKSSPGRPAPALADGVGDAVDAQARRRQQRSPGRGLPAATPPVDEGGWALACDSAGGAATAPATGAATPRLAGRRRDAGPRRHARQRRWTRPVRGTRERRGAGQRLGCRCGSRDDRDVLTATNGRRVRPLQSSSSVHPGGPRPETEALGPVAVMSAVTHSASSFRPAVPERLQGRPASRDLRTRSPTPSMRSPRWSRSRWRTRSRG